MKAAGASEVDFALLKSVSIQVADLGGDLLGVTLGNSILIDADAAGVGFFVDATPGDDLEFQTATGYAVVPEAATGWTSERDRATEPGHVLGLPDLDSAEDPKYFLAHRITPGIRRFVTEEDLNALDAAFRSNSLANLLD